MNWKNFLDALDRILHALVHGDKVQYIQPMEIPPEVVMAPVVQKNSEKLYDLAKSYLGKDIAKTQNELGCAEAISYLLLRLKCPSFPAGGFLSTAQLYDWLQRSFYKVTVPLPGDIIISPTGTSTKGAEHGHVGIIGYHGILSNNSMTGLFDEYYTDTKWREYYNERLGFPILYFRWI